MSLAVILARNMDAVVLSCPWYNLLFFFILGYEYPMNENTKMYQGKIEPKHIQRFRFFKFIFRCCENASLNNSLFTSHHIINPRSCSSSVTPCKNQVRSISLHTAFLLFCRAPSMRRLFKKYCHSRISSFLFMLIGFEKTPSEEHWFCLVIWPRDSSPCQHTAIHLIDWSGTWQFAGLLTNCW